MKLSSTRASKKARIEIIPLIDIMFFLLATFVMVSISMVQNKGIAVKLPAAATSSELPQEQIVRVSIDEDGKIYIDKSVVTIDELAEKMRTLHGGDPQSTVIVNGDVAAEFGAVLSVMDTVRRSGLQRVTFQTTAQRGQS